MWGEIQICSDLHLDQIKKYHFSRMVSPIGKILIMAGDICHIVNLHKHFDFFSYLSSHFEYVIYVPGNHEFYNNLNLTIEELENKINIFLGNFSNIYYLNNKSVVINDILFTGSCLWCSPSIDPPPWFKVNLSSKDIKNLYNQSVNYIEKVCSLNYKNHIVITHYPPILIDFINSDENSGKNEVGDVDNVGNFENKKHIKYNEYYQNNDIILFNMPKIWIFGHIHKNYNSFLYGTSYISNQYKGKNYNPRYCL